MTVQTHSDVVPADAEAFVAWLEGSLTEWRDRVERAARKAIAAAPDATRRRQIRHLADNSGHVPPAVVERLLLLYASRASVDEMVATYEREILPTLSPRNLEAVEEWLAAGAYEVTAGSAPLVVARLRHPAQRTRWTARRATPDLPTTVSERAAVINANAPPTNTSLQRPGFPVEVLI